MSASSTPTLSPRSRRPSARLTAVVDLPTPPLPDATAMMAPTPGTPMVPWARCAAAAAAGEVAPRLRPRRRGAAARRTRSAVSATMTEATPGSALTAASARLRTGSQAFDHGGIDRDREEHLAVGDDDVGQGAGVGKRHAFGTGYASEARQNLSLGQCHHALQWPPRAGLRGAGVQPIHKIGTRAAGSNVSAWLAARTTAIPRVTGRCGRCPDKASRVQ